MDVDKNDGNVNNAYFAVGGVPFVNTKFVRLTEGSPYFKDEWSKGLLLLEGDKQYKGLLKLDLYSNEVHYQDVKGNDFVVAQPIKKIVFTDALATLSFVHASLLPKSTVPNKAGWYLELYSDSAASLYKYFVKELTENRPYNSATYEQKIRTVDVYRVHYNNSAVEIKKLKDAPSLFGDKKAALEGFLKTGDDKKASMDDRMIAFVTYLNSLLTPAK
ncbi:MAG TPA: hypothetical protein VEV15_11310 [Flavisolibacter sp.]|nr:hypothetical protein [Flavisolibacter sp.]